MSETDEKDSRPALAPGCVGTLELRVTAHEAASAYGNVGVEVLATPKLVHLIESASVLAIRDVLQPGESTVGTKIEVLHLAATPVGMKISVRATLRQIDGRRLTFEAEAHDEVDLIATGTHERVVIDLARFLERVEKKKARSNG